MPYDEGNSRELTQWDLRHQEKPGPETYQPEYFFTFHA